MIKPLKRIIVEQSEDGTQVSKLPDSETMMNKINEIIKYVNNHEGKIRLEDCGDFFKTRQG